MDRREKPLDRLVAIWNAFMQLDRMRVMDGMNGPQPINTRDIKAWMWIHDITDSDLKVEYYTLICVLDAKRLDWLNDEHKRRHPKEDEDGGTSTNDQRATRETRRD